MKKSLCKSTLFFEMIAVSISYEHKNKHRLVGQGCAYNSCPPVWIFIP
jgi:hypothetical protein